MTIRRRRYALGAAIVLIVEVAIALFVEDRLIRPLVGDSLAVILVYLMLRAATGLRLWPAVAIALGVAFAVELGQLLGILDLLGLGGNRLLRVLLGASFDPLDLAAYTVGAVAILTAETLLARRVAAASRD